MKTHYFLGVSVPDRVGFELNDWIGSNKSNLPFKNWVVPADYHITLHFLGDVTAQQMKDIRENIPNITEEMASFHLEIDHFGLFGRASEPHVFWAGLKGQPALADLQKKMGPVCEQAGLALENRPYRPHVTLARKWAGVGAFPVPSFPNAGHSSNRRWVVEDVVLYQSHLNRSPKYEAIARFPLNA